MQATVRPAGQQFYPDEHRVSNWLDRMNIRCVEWLGMSPSEQDARIFVTSQARGLSITPTQAHDIATRLTSSCNLEVGQAPITSDGQIIPRIAEDPGGWTPVYLSPTVVPLFAASYPWFGSAWWRIREDWWPYLIKNNFANWPVNWPLWTGRQWIMRRGPVAGTAIRTSMISNRPGVLTPAAMKAAGQVAAKTSLLRQAVSGTATRLPLPPGVSVNDLIAQPVPAQTAVDAQTAITTQQPSSSATQIVDGVPNWALWITGALGVAAIAGAAYTGTVARDNQRGTRRRNRRFAKSFGRPRNSKHLT